MDTTPQIIVGLIFEEDEVAVIFPDGSKMQTTRAHLADDLESESQKRELPAIVESKEEPREQVITTDAKGAQVMSVDDAFGEIGRFVRGHAESAYGSGLTNAVASLGQRGVESLRGSSRQGRSAKARLRANRRRSE